MNGPLSHLLYTINDSWYGSTKTFLDPCVAERILMSTQTTTTGTSQFVELSPNLMRSQVNRSIPFPDSGRTMSNWKSQFHVQVKVRFQVFQFGTHPQYYGQINLCRTGARPDLANLVTICTRNFFIRSTQIQLRDERIQPSYTKVVSFPKLKRPYLSESRHLSEMMSTAFHWLIQPFYPLLPTPKKFLWQQEWK